MNIGIVTAWFERGASYVSRQYMDALQCENDVFIYARDGLYAHKNPAYNLPNVTWGKRTGMPLSTAVNLEDFRQWLARNNIDMVFFNEQHWWKPVLLCNSMGILTGAYIDYYTESTVPLFGCYDFLVCNTRMHYSVFDWHPQAFYVSWGTDVNLFKPKSYKDVDPGYVTFFHSCGFSPQRKGTDLLIKAFAKVKEQGKLFIHSQKKLKKLLPEQSNLIDELVSSERLAICEATVPAPGLYHKGDVYVYPSRLDGIGLTVAEALACGLPVITSDNAPMNEFVNELSGKLVRVKKFYKRKDNYYWPQCVVDIEHLTECMEYYIEEMNELESFKRFARQSAVDHFDWGKNAIVLSSVFSNVRSLAAGKKEAEALARQYDEKISTFALSIYKKAPWLMYSYRLIKTLFQ